MKEKGYSLRGIAKALGRSVSSISDELKRNIVDGEYDAKKANHKAYVRRKESKYQGMKIVASLEIQKFVDKKLLDDQSPSAIDKRPIYINTRKRFGDMEADFVVSGKGGSGILLVVVDRKSRMVFLKLLLVVKIENVHTALIEIQKKYPLMKSITLDNDILFRKHKELKSLLGVPLYFCHPYHSWEKGTVENANKYIRRDIPKGRDLSKYSEEYVQSLEDKLNRRSMKCLNYKTPTEVLSEYLRQKNLL